MKRTIIIGATGDLGSTIVQAAIKRGDNVAALDLNDESGTGHIYSGAIDLRDEVSVRSALYAAVDALGGLDTVINASGIMDFNSLLQLEDDAFCNVLEVNLTGAFRITQNVAEYLIQGGGGSIVHLSSMHGRLGASHRAAYAASKGGLDAFVRAVAVELGPHNVNINCVAPGPSGQGMGNESYQRQQFESSVPMRREASREEVAAAVMYLTSKIARNITGHVLPVDGGATATLGLNAGQVF